MERTSPHANSVRIVTNQTYEGQAFWEACSIQLNKKLLIFNGSRKLFILFIRNSHWIVSQANLIQSTPSHPLFNIYFNIIHRGSSVDITLSYWLDDWGSRFRFPAGAGNFSLHHCVRNASGAHPDSYSMGTRVSFPGRKADHTPPSSVNVKEWMELYLHFPIRLHGVVLS
jgi:hypothetical protein